MHNQNVNVMGKPSTYWMNISPYPFLLRYVSIISYVFFSFYVCCIPLYNCVNVCECVFDSNMQVRCIAFVVLLEYEPSGLLIIIGEILQWV